MNDFPEQLRQVLAAEGIVNWQVDDLYDVQVDGTFELDGTEQRELTWLHSG